MWWEGCWDGAEGESSMLLMMMQMGMMTNMMHLLLIRNIDHDKTCLCCCWMQMHGEKFRGFGMVGGYNVLLC